MRASFSRAECRRHTGRITSEGLDRALEIDRRFFKRHGDRRYRMRLASRAEVDGLVTAYGSAATVLVPGERWFAVVHQIVPGGWVKLFLPAPAENEIDVPEAWIAALYVQLAARSTMAGDIEVATRDLALRNAIR